MIKSLIKVGFMLAIGIIGYNYFLGDPDEKAQSKEIISKVGDGVKAVGGVFKGEYQKMRDGKYDKAFEKIGGALEKGKEKLKGGKELLSKIDDWNDRQSEWRKTKRDLKKQWESAGDDEKDKIGEAIKEHNEEAERLAKEGEELKAEQEKAE